MSKKNEVLPQMIIVADEDEKEGIDRGYYPELKDVVSRGNVKIYDYDSVDKNLLSTEPNIGVSTCYVLNKYTRRYIDLNDDSIHNQLISDKCHAVRDALVRMGAKSISLKRNISDVLIEDTTIEGGGGYKTTSAGGKASHSSRHSVNITAELYSHDPNRKPKSVKDIQTYLVKTGLNNESFLTTLLDRLKDDEDKRLRGKELMKITFLSEMKDVRKITASLKVSVLFNASMDYEKNVSHTHAFSEIIEVDFGE